MKGILIVTAILFLFSLIGCSSNDVTDNDINKQRNTKVALNPGLNGLWAADNASIPDAITKVSMRAGKLYIFFSGLTGESTSLSVYRKSETRNCLNLTGPDELTFAGKDLSLDRAGHSILLRVDAEQTRLNTTVNVDGAMAQFGLSRTDDIDISDLQVCAPRQQRSISSGTALLSEMLQVMQEWTATSGLRQRYRS